MCRALEAHGGSYSWWNSNTGDWAEDYPIIAVNVGGMCPNPTDVIVRSVSIVGGELCFDAEDKEYGYNVEFEADDVFAGHLGFIVDCIPATESVGDVTTQQEYFEIISVSRCDLEDCGYDASDISDAIMRGIANKMGDYMMSDDYSDAVRAAADRFGIPKREEDASND